MPFLPSVAHDQKVRCAAVAVAMGLAFCMPLSRAVAADDSIVGDWKFIKVIDSVDVTSLDDQGAKKLLGKVMAIRKDGARFDNQKCSAPGLEAVRVEPDLYLKNEGGIDNSRLRLPRPVTVIDISCAMVFVKSRNLAVITWGGYFFEAARVKR